MKFWENRPKHIAEYFALRAVAALVRALPYHVALAVGAGLAWVGFHVVRWRRAGAEARIREVFGSQYSAREVRRIAWVSMRNMCFNAVEALRLPGLTRAWVDVHTEFTGLEKVWEVSGKGGCILVVPHTGSWDLAGVSGHLLKFPMFMIVGSQKNPLTNAFLNQMRGVTGVETIPRDSGALRGAIKRLKDGKMLTFMTDLRSKTPGVRVKFLGKDANLVAGMGMFARMANVPIVPVVVTRRGWGRHAWHVHDAVYPDAAVDRDVDVQRMTQSVMDIYEKAIRAEPEQYFWYNKRWVLEPLAEEVSDQKSEVGSAKPAG